MKNLIYTIVFLFFSNNILLADGHALPKNGKINWLTGWQFNLNPAEPQSDGWNVMSGAAIGSTFNTLGKGPLHEGRAMCTGSIVMSEKINTFTGHCYFGDKDGDRIFTSYSGDPIKNAGENIIIGGTGKYKGISRKGPWDCDGAKPGDHGAFNCRQTLVYTIN